MSRRRLIIFIGSICFILLSSQTIAQRYNRHNIYLNGSVGYNSLLTDAPPITPAGSYGAGLGVGYELNYKAFILQLGAEATYLNAGLKHDPFIVSKEMIDSEGDFYIGNYQLSNNKDYYNYANVNIPLMLGFRIKPFYFLVGGKVGLNLYSNSKTTSSVTSTGSYPGFIEDLEDMPDHNFTTRKETAGYKVPLNMNASLSGEIGVNLKSSEEKNIRYRLAAFVDYGLLDLHDNSKNESLLLEREDDSRPYSPYLNSFMLSEPLKDRFVNNMYAGVRFTIVFGIPQQEPCHCGEDFLPKRSKRGKKIRYKR